MSHRDPLGLAPDVVELIRQEQSEPQAPAHARRRVLRRLESTLGLPPIGGPGSGGPDHSGSVNAEPATSLAPSPATSAGISSILSHPAVFGLATFLSGVVVGVGVHSEYVRTTTQPPPMVASHAPETPVVAPSLAPSATAEPPLSAPIKSAEIRTSPSVNASTVDAEAPGKDVSLAAERALIETARMAIARGQSADALSTLQKHAQQFPRGRLTEEREVLWIQALVASGRTSDAQSRAQIFRKTFPRSLALPAIDTATGSNP